MTDLFKKYFSLKYIFLQLEYFLEKIIRTNKYKCKKNKSEIKICF